MSVTIRQRLSDVANRFEHIEVALFSSFTFNADFFEQNVLPALFGVDPQSSRVVREQGVHRGLRETEVGVFCDPTLIKPSAKAYRYTTYPVFVEGRLFHPKNIILIGLDPQGTRWVYIAVMSANLSLSGWGRQCEGFADTWLPAPRQQPMLELKNYLEWLENNVHADTRSGPLQRAMSLLQAVGLRRKIADPEHAEGSRVSPCLYFSPLHDSLWQFAQQQYGAIKAVKAASPYWGDATRIAARLPTVNWTLVAARKPPLMNQVYLGQDTLDQLYANGEDREVTTWKDPAGRFHHIKLYELQTQGGTVTAIGSCNFTCNGQFWLGSDGTPHGNVESMLFDTQSLQWPDTEPLNPQQIPATSQDEDTPKPWPFCVGVVYDWQTRQFTCQLHGDIAVGKVSLNLRDSRPPVVLDAQCRVYEEQGDLVSRSFSLTWGEQTQVGIVTETNLQASTEVYGTPLSVQAILESWRSGLPFEPLPADPEGQEGQEGQEGETCLQPYGISVVANELAFDSFELFQALKARRKKLADPAQQGQHLELLIHRNDSVAALARAFTRADVPDTAKWIVYRECRSFFDGHSDEMIQEVSRDLDEAIAQVRPAVAQAIARELQGRRPGVEPEALLTWYEHQFTGSQQ